MKKFLLGAAGLVSFALTAPALAADLPARPYNKAPLVAEVYNWTGFYIGGNVGGAFSPKTWDVYDPLYNQYFSEGEHSAVGAIAGGQVGYRWQTSSWVFGVEAQGNWAHLRGWNTSTDNFSQDNYTRIDSLGLFTGQLGYAWDSALIYVKGGAAVVKDRYTIFDNTVTPIVPLATSSQTRWGATIGVGLEYGFTPNWTAGIEYNHAFLGDKTVNLYDSAGFLYQTDRIHQDLDMVTLRLNYKFVYGAVVAKY